MLITKKKHTEILRVMKDDIILAMKQAFKSVVDSQRSTILRLQTDNDRLKFELENANLLLKKRKKK